MRVVCTICTDQIQNDLCAAPCGHTFHFQCLSEWLAHQKNCPQCREKCLPRNVIKLYTDSSDLTRAVPECMEPEEMREKLSLQDNLLAHKDQALVEARTELSSIQKEMKAWQAQHKEIHKKLKKEQTFNEVLRRQLSSAHTELDEAEQRKKELEVLKARLATLEGVEKMLAGSAEEIDDVIISHKASPNLATFFVALKRDYEVVKRKRATLVKEKVQLSGDISYLKKQLVSKENQISVLEIDVQSAEEEKKTLQKKIEMLQAAIDSPGSRNALKRILESPMPDQVRSIADCGASPELVGARARPRPVVHDDHDVPVVIVTGAKRPSARNKENIVLPVKMFKTDRAPPHFSLKPYSSHVLKTGLKFAPRKNSIIDHTTRYH